MLASRLQVFACLGDSLTRGQASANYLHLLEKLKPGVDFLNYGVDGELVADAQLRAEELLKSQPDGIIIMLGTNDVRHTFSKAKAKRQSQIDASANTFRANMEKLIGYFQENSKAKLVVVGIPFLDESFKSGVEVLVAEFNEILRETCLCHKLTFVDVHAPMLSDFKNSKFHPPKVFKDVKATVYRALVLKKVFRLSWNQISDLQKSYFHTDFAHLNDRAAKIIATQIAAVI